MHFFSHLDDLRAHMASANFDSVFCLFVFFAEMLQNWQAMNVWCALHNAHLLKQGASRMPSQYEKEKSNDEHCLLLAWMSIPILIYFFIYIYNSGKSKTCHKLFGDAKWRRLLWQNIIAIVDACAWAERDSLCAPQRSEPPRATHTGVPSV